MSIFEGDGINFAYSGSTWTEPLLTQRLTYLWNLGFRSLRIVGAVYTGTGTISQIKFIVDTALTFGFEVMNGTTVNGASNLTSTTYTDFENVVLGLASYFNDHPNANKFILWLQNEDDPRVDGVTLTTAQFQANIRALSVTIHATYPNIKTCVCVTTNYSADWRATPGDLDYVGLNPYGNRHTFHSQINAWWYALGSKGIITEWNTTLGTSDYSGVNAQYNHELEVASRKNRINSFRMKNYSFYYDGSQGVTGQQWAFFRNPTGGQESFIKAWDIYLNPRVALVDNYRYPTVNGVDV